MEVDHSKYQSEEVTQEVQSKQPFHLENAEWSQDEYGNWIAPEWQPQFSRESLTRRVLGTVTDEEHYEGRPRNTLEDVTQFLASDPVVSGVQHQQLVEDPANPGQYGVTTSPLVVVKKELDKLVEAGLLEQREDGSYERTENGWIELSN